MYENFNHVNIVIKSSKSEIFLNNKRYMRKNNFTLNDFNVWVRNNLSYKPLYSSDNKGKYISHSCENSEMPYISFCFYLLFISLKRPPKLGELISKYLSLYCIKNKDGTYSLKECFGEPDLKIKKEHIYGRIFRSYYSFIRELHAILISQDVNENFYYNFKKDLNGIDICLGDDIGIASFVATKRSLAFKNKKATSRHKYNVKLLDLPAVIDKSSEMYNCIDVNGILLYDEKKARKVIKNFLKLNE